jgi:hypothetical protein
MHTDKIETASIFITNATGPEEKFLICSRCVPNLRTAINSFTPGTITARSKKQHFHAKDKREKFHEDLYKFYDCNTALEDRMPRAIESVEFVGLLILGKALRSIHALIKKMFNAMFAYDDAKFKNCPCCGMDTPGWEYSKYYEEVEE